MLREGRAVLVSVMIIRSGVPVHVYAFPFLIAHWHCCDLVNPYPSRISVGDMALDEKVGGLETVHSIDPATPLEKRDVSLLEREIQ